MKLINKKKFAKTALDENSEIFVMHMTALEAPLSRFLIHLDRKTQIGSLLIKKVTIPNKNFDFANIFSEEKALVLPEQTELNKYTIKLEGNKESSYRPIYSLGPGELETLKA